MKHWIAFVEIETADDVTKEQVVETLERMQSDYADEKEYRQQSTISKMALIPTTVFADTNKP